MSLQQTAQTALEADWGQPEYAELPGEGQQSSYPQEETSHQEYTTVSAQHMANLKHAYESCSQNLRIIQQRYFKTFQNYQALHRQYDDLYQDSRHDKKTIEIQKNLILQLESVIEVCRTGYLALPINDGTGMGAPGPSVPAMTSSSMPQTPAIMPLAEPTVHRTGGPLAAGAVRTSTDSAGISQYPSSSFGGLSSSPPPKSPAKHRSNAGVSKKSRKNGKQSQQSLEALTASQLAPTE